MTEPTQVLPKIAGDFKLYVLSVVVKYFSSQVVIFKLQFKNTFCKKGLKINSESYCDLVLDNQSPYLQALYPEKNGLYFLQDGAPSHTSEESLKCVRKIFGAKNAIQNPPNSPDLNVLDYHTWDHMDKMVQQNKDIVTLADLEREVVRS